MSTSKHIEKICIAAIVVSLVMTLLTAWAYSSGLVLTDNSMGYENRLFNTDTVHTVDIVMNNWDSFIENCESEEYSSCTVVIDGEKFSNVALRAKGNTSLSSVRSMGSSRYSFKLEFDHYEDAKSYYGLDKLCLNNLIQDTTMMKDYLTYRMMGEFGADSPLCSYVYITVNGEDWGLYLAVEGVEDSFLNRNYGSDTGEMYKPDSLNFGAGRGNGKDFDMNDLETSDEETESDNTSQMPGGFDFGSMPQMPDGTDSGNGMQMPGDFDFGGMPQMPDGTDSGNGMQMPGGFDFGSMPQMPDGTDFGDASQIPDTSESGSSTQKNAGGFGGFAGFGGFGGMGSDDIKLKYSDDDPDSYSGIFDSAKTDISNADKTRLIKALKNLNENTDLEDTLDMDEVLRYFVVHNFVVNGDSYTGSMIHNYYLHEKDGKLGMIPWDYNLAFGTFMGGAASSSVNASVDGLVSGGDVSDRPMFGWIFSSEEYTEMYHNLYSEFVSEWIDGGKLEELIATTADMISSYVQKDPTKFCTYEDFETGVEAITKFVSLRGEAVKRQLNGDNSTVDTAGLNTSDMGSMNSGTGKSGSFSKPETSGVSDKDSSDNGNSGNGSSDEGSSGNGSSGESSSGRDFSGMGFPSGDFAGNSFPGNDSSGNSSLGKNSSGKNFSSRSAGGSSTFSLESVIWLAVSLVILGVGIVVAKKKRRR